MGRRIAAWSRIAVALVALVVAMAVCGARAGAETADGSDAAPSTPSAGGQAAPSLEFDSLRDLAGKRLGDINGSTLCEVATDTIAGLSLDDFSYYNSVSDEVAALKAAKIDAFVQDEPVARLAVSRNDGIGIVPEYINDADYGFFFKKGNPLVGKFDEIIQGLADDGTLDALKAKWTGADEAAKTLPEQDWDMPNGTLKMATIGTQEPLVYQSGDQFIGYDVEVALLCCERLGYGLEVEAMDIAALMASVPTGKCDFGGGGMTITEERRKTADFTVPDYRGAIVAVVRTTDQGTGGSFLEGVLSSFEKTFVVEGRWKLIAGGLGVTLLISLCSGVLGLLLGYGSAVVRRNGARWATALIDGYQDLMGGVPVVVVLMALYYVVFGAVDIPGVVVAVMGFALSFGATAGSTIWTALSGISQVQEETGLALGYTRQQVFRKIVFPQAAQQFRPQLIGQFVSLLKETAVVGYIAVQDLTRASDLIRSRTMDAFFPIISTAIIYYVACRVLARVLRRLTARMDTHNRPRTVEGVTQ